MYIYNFRLSVLQFNLFNGLELKYADWAVVERKKELKSYGPFRLSGMICSLELDSCAERYMMSL